MKKIVIGMSLALAAGSVLAEDSSFDDRWYITPNVSFVKPDTDKNVSSGLEFGASIGKFISEKISMDLELSTSNFDKVGGAGSITETTLGLMGRYHFTETSGFLPYLGLGAGFKKHSGLASNAQIHRGLTSAGNDAVLNLAAGMSKELTDRVKLRTELRYQMENSDDLASGEDTFGNYMFNTGLTVAFGEVAQQTTVTKLVEQAPTLDGDNDGVSDANDRCPNSVAGAKVDSTGCEIVIDGDDDRDGVANSRDLCPNSQAGAVVGDDGCEVKVVIELQGVHFDTDKSTLKPESISILDAAVKTLGDHGTILVEVAGHTDSRASDAYNQSLSQRRAKVVFDYLTAHGINADRMTWKGYGESQPIATNETEDGRARNRRTELIVK
ncbi:MAG: OmpA family protein [Proteobacteria bacterium]|nr:OmpA family protein [Pseudomonadota bacterium]